MIVIRKVFAFMFFSLIVLVLSIGIYFIAFPPLDWADLWNEKVLELPVAVIITGASLSLGLIIGLGSALNELGRRKILLNQLDNVLQLDNDSDAKDYPEDLNEIINKLANIKEKYHDQILITQKLVNERAEEQEKHVEEIISQERNRLARELHDSVSQQLFAASMLMSAINETNEHEALSRQLNMVEDMIHQSQLEMRALLLHLRPVPLNGKSLQEGIEELLVDLKMKVPITIDWNTENIHLEKGIEDQLFRIVQESVSNTLRHAKATKLEVLFIERDQFVILRITDNGIGFRIEDSSKTASYGLQNMKERAKEIGASFKIVSLPGKGTRLEVKVPIWDNRLHVEE